MDSCYKKCVVLAIYCVIKQSNYLNTYARQLHDFFNSLLGTGRLMIDTNLRANSFFV